MLGFGNSQRPRIYHSGGHSHVQDTGSGELKLAGDVVRITNTCALVKHKQDSYKTDQQNYITDNVRTLYTENGGVQIVGVTTSQGGFSGNLSGAALIDSSVKFC